MSLRTAALRAMCRMIDHRNDISHVDENSIYIHDQCSRCGSTLPIAYPHHKEYQKEYQKFKQYYASLDEEWRKLFEVPRSNYQETV